MTVQLSQDGLWFEGTMYIGPGPNPRFSILKSTIFSVLEATWMTDQDGNPVTATQVIYGQNASSNVLASYDEVIAALNPTTP